MPTRKWKVAGSYLLYNELYYNGLMTDWGSEGRARAMWDETTGRFYSILPPFIEVFPHARVTRAPSLGFCTFCFHNLHTSHPEVTLFRLG